MKDMLQELVKQLRPKKTDFQHPRKKEREQHEREVTLKWATHNPCSPVNLGPKIEFCTKGNRPSYNRNFWTIFCGFWRLLGRLEKEEEENEDEKHDNWKNKRKENIGKTKEKKKKEKEKTRSKEKKRKTEERKYEKMKKQEK